MAARSLPVFFYFIFITARAVNIVRLFYEIIILDECVLMKFVELFASAQIGSKGKGGRD